MRKAALRQPQRQPQRQSQREMQQDIDRILTRLDAEIPEAKKEMDELRSWPAGTAGRH